MPFINIEINKQFIDNMLLGIEGALASFLNSALGFSPTLFLQLPRSCIPCMKFTSPKLYIRPVFVGYDQKNNRQIKRCNLGNPKNSVGLKPNAELRKDAKAPSAFIGAELEIQCLSSILKSTNNLLIICFWY